MAEDYMYNGLMYSESKVKALEILPYLTAPFSAIGSLMILYSIWYDRKTTRKSMYHRLMLGISVLDFCSSASLVILGPWAVPKQVEFTTMGRGTFTTCAISGFFFNLFFGTMWYSAFLSLYFLLLVRYERQESKLALRFEPFAHLISIVAALATSSYGVRNNLFNPMRELPGWCWYMDYPPYCSTLDSEAPDCVRGGDYGVLSGFGGPSTIIPILLIVTISMLLIVLKVHNTEKQLRHYGHGQNGNLERTKETAWQGLLYIFAFLVVYAPITMLHFFGDRGTPSNQKRVVFAASVLTKLVTPLQGFFNAYIYFNKRFWSLTKEGACFGFLRCFPILGPWICEKSDQVRSIHGSRRGNTPPMSSNHATRHTQATNFEAEPSSLNQISRNGANDLEDESPHDEGGT